MRTVRRLTGALAISVLLTIATISIERRRLEVQDWDCPPAPASCARPVVVGGYPFPFVVDFHGVSVVNSVSLSGAILGEDFFLWLPFLTDVLIYFFVVLALWTGIQALRGPRGRGVS